MNPVFVKWWQSIGGTAQVTIIIAALGGLFGLIKYLFERRPKLAVVICAIFVVGVLGFIFWPAWASLPGAAPSPAPSGVAAKPKPKPPPPATSHDTVDHDGHHRP